MENSLDKSLFVKATDEEKASAEVKRESVTYWQDDSKKIELLWFLL